MNKGNIIAKGKYNYPRDERLAYVTDYLIMKENGKKFLVLRFFNPRKETLNNLRFKLEQLNSEGKTISSKYVFLDKLNGGEEGVFVPENKISIAADCVDFRVTVSSVGYGSYNYSVVGGEVRVEYVETQDNSANISDFKSKTGGKNPLIRHRKLGFPLFICLFSVILVACIAVFTYFQLNNFKETENSFTLNKVEYTFIDGDKGKDGTLSVTGYSGKNSELTIPAAIDGYCITEIATDAFKGNNVIKKITFGDTIDLCEGAFADCANLAYVDFSDVNTIGQRAFENCTSLTSFESGSISYIGKSAFSNCTSLQQILLTEDSTDSNNSVYIDESAFAYCSGLKKITIEKSVQYIGKNCNIFKQCTNVTYLKLKGLGKFYFVTPNLTQLFNTDTSALNIQEIILDECDEISYGMCQGLTKLTDFTVYNCNSDYIGGYAFADCSALNGIHLDKPVTGVGEYAFLNSGISSFDFSSVNDLGVGAFKNCNNLDSVETLADSDVYVIPDEAFSGCVKLSGLTVPASTVRICKSAFSDCSALREIIFPSKCKLTAIEDTAFYNCTSLERIALPSTVTEVGKYAFLNCTSAESLTIPSLGIINAGAFKNCSSIGIVNIPNGVTEIAQDAFAYCTELKSVSFPDSLTNIGNGAFSYCSSLTEITIPDTVTSIGYGAFRSCNSLSSYTASFVGGSVNDNTYMQYVFGGFIYSHNCVPESLATVTVTSAVDIPAYAFAACSNITQVNIPDIVTEIGDYAFAECKNLEQIELPDKLSVIGQYAFSECKKLTQVDFPDGLTEIGNYAFSNCTSLSGLVIPENVQSMGFAVFKGCDGLETLSIPFVGLTYDSYNYIAYNFGLSYGVNNAIPQSLKTITVTKASLIDEKAFYGSKYLTQIDLPDSLINIGNYAFEGCSSLSELIIPDSVQSLGLGVFKDCNGLESLTLPFVGLTSNTNCYLAYNFGYENSLTYNYLPQSLKTITVTKASSIGTYAFYGNSNLAQVNLPENLTEIGAYAFADCSRLNKINLPENLRLISDSAFSGCFRLYEVKNDSSLSIEAGSNLNGGVAQYALKVYSPYETEGQRINVDGYEFIELDSGWYLVAYPYGSKSLSLPETFKASEGDVSGYSVAQRLFYNDKKLSDVELPSSVNDLGVSIFEYCINLKEVMISDDCGITCLPTNCFSNCTFLNTINLPSGLINIESGAFFNCKSLNYITVTENVTEIANQAFTNCFNLREVFNKSSLEIVKGNTDNGGVARWAIAVYTPDNRLPKVSYFTVDGINFAYYRGDYMVIGCDSSLTEIDFTEITYDGSVISSYSIAPGSFYNNGNLLSVNFGKEVTDIGGYAFTYCTNISSVTFEGTALKEIGSYAFGYCEKLERLVLPEGLTGISSSAFYNCKGLLSVTLPSTLEYIKNYAFYGCQGILEVFNSSSLALSKGSTTNGNVAQYALFIYDSADAESLIEQTDSFTFAYLNEQWTLISVKSGVTFDGYTCILPESFEHNGRTISSYAVAADVFNNTSIYYMVIPTSVKAIADNSFYVWDIYYCGTKEEWSYLTGGDTYKFSFDVFYYADCVHESNRWTYGGNGQIIYVTQNHYETGVEASCISEGEEWLVCDWCGEVLSITVLDKTLHNLNEYGVCTVCGDEGIIFTEDNIDELGLAVNDSTYPYELGEDGVFSSVNVQLGSRSTLTINADRKMQIAISFDLTGGTTDYLTISYGGVKYTYYAETLGWSDLIYLDASDTLIITFKCGYETVEDRGVDVKLKMYFLSEEAA